MIGKIVSVNISENKGMRKIPVNEARVIAGHGIEGDAHASGKWHRQVSLLAIESINKMQRMGLDVGPGDFAENITTEGIDLMSMPVGTKTTIGNSVETEITQTGKQCHTRCEIFRQAGDCVMPKEGIFVRILRGGTLRKGDPITCDQGMRTYT
jgi:MOSC domain-containing protein YiiM